MKLNRKQQKEQTRNKILQSAYRVYARQGFSAATAAVAKEAGVAHGSVFVHFPSAESLITAAATHFGRVLGRQLHDLAETGSGIEALLNRYIEILAAYEAFYIRLLTEKSLLPMAAQETLLETQAVAAYHFYTVVTAEIESGRVKDLPPHILFNCFLGFIQYYLTNKALFSPDAPLLARYQQELVTAYLQLIET